MQRMIVYKKKHRRKLILYKSLVFLSIIGALLIAAHLNKLNLPTIEKKASWATGWIILIIIGFLAIFNRIKILFKIKSMGFIVVLIILSLLRVGIDTLITGLWLISIPLLIDDLIIENYFKYVDIKYYGNWQKNE